MFVSFCIFSIFAPFVYAILTLFFSTHANVKVKLKMGTYSSDYGSVT